MSSIRSYYRTCPKCGGNIDAGEVCNCGEEIAPAQKIDLLKSSGRSKRGSLQVLMTLVSCTVTDIDRCEGGFVIKARSLMGKSRRVVIKVVDGSLQAYISSASGEVTA